MAEEDKKLAMKFDPKVIQHLGIRMYSTLPPVLSELIANAYDADATEVEVELEDIGAKKIVVKDNGIGMSFADIDEKFLVIGRNRREDGDGLTPKGRKVIGKKGLGKLSFFGIVQTITVNTIKRGKRNIFTMDWNALLSSDGQYLIAPDVIDETVEGSDTGTTIELSNVKRESDFSEELLANSLARFFVCDEDFSVTIRRNGGEAVVLSNEMHFSAFGEEFSWDSPKDFDHIESDYEHRFKIIGKIITPDKPIAPRFDSRGISLFSRGKRVQSPYQFSNSTSSHFFSYMTGSLTVDFIEDFPEDVISTNRQDLNWGYSQTDELHKYLEKCVQFVQEDWRKKRRDKKVVEIDKHSDDIGLEGWLGSMPEGIRDSVQIFTQSIVTDFPEIEAGKSNQLLSKLKKIIPPYPYYHWRELHPYIKDDLYEDYKGERYFEAAREGAIIYENTVKDKSKLQDSGVALMRKSFGIKSSKDKEKTHSDDPPIIQISNLSTQTETNIQEGQVSLSVGLMQAFRNPANHERRETLQALFSEIDCLNILSLVSFLLHRLDNAKNND